MTRANVDTAVRKAVDDFCGRRMRNLPDDVGIAAAVELADDKESADLS
jgi:hypothetical protein